MSAHHHIIFAVAPLAVAGVLVVAGVIGGVFAIFRKKKAALPPGADPGDTEAAPFLNLKSGTTTAMLAANGSNWAWSLSGATTTAGSDGDAGKAAIAMATALEAAVDEAPITGSAGGPDDPTIDLGVETDVDGNWLWSLTGKSKLPNPHPGIPLPPILYKSGSAPSRSLALLAALTALSAHLSWISIAPPKEGGDLSIPGTTKEIHGVVISADGMTVAITNLAQWIAFAAPSARELLESNKTADEIMDETLADLPEGAKLNGKPIADVRKRVDDLLNMVRSDSYVVVASPDEELAAMIVGAQLRPEDWWVAEYKGYVILVRPVAEHGGGGGFKGPASARWQWLIWEGGSRGFDDQAIDVGTMSEGKNRNNAIRYAKQRIDQAINSNGEFPGTGEAGGNKGATVNPDWNDPKVDLQFIPGAVVLDAPNYMPDVVTRDMPGALWTKDKTLDIEIFDFKDGVFAKFKHWRVALGVCITLDSPTPFGTLSSWLAAGAGAFGGLTADQANKIKIQNSDFMDGGFGPRPPVDWQSFDKPLVWKGQFDGGIERGPTFGVHPFKDITGTGEGDQVDPCPDKETHWPNPSNDELGFYVQPQGSVNFQQWNPAPTVKLLTKHGDTKIYARITYRGFPVFLLGGGVAQAQVGFPTNFKLTYQIWAGGTNREE